MEKLFCLISKHGALNDEHRTLLADVIINEHLKDDYDYSRKLPAEVEKAMADQIKKLVTTESLAIWISSAKNSRQKSTGRGLLLTRYYRSRRLLRKENLIRSARVQREGGSSSDNDDDNHQEGVNDMLLWLNNNTQPWVSMEGLLAVNLHALVLHLPASLNHGELLGGAAQCLRGASNIRDLTLWVPASLVAAAGEDHVVVALGQLLEALAASGPAHPRHLTIGVQADSDAPTHLGAAPRGLADLLGASPAIQEVDVSEVFGPAEDALSTISQQRTPRLRRVAFAFPLTGAGVGCNHQSAADVLDGAVVAAAQRLPGVVLSLGPCPRCEHQCSSEL